MTANVTNPFSVFTPEGLGADTVVAIFSTAMPGLANLREPGHAFVTGTRGSGKSILFRYLEPDCQKLVTALDVDELPHFALYVSFRETEAQISELARFENQHGQVFFNEHLLVLSIAARFTSRLIKNGLASGRPFPSSDSIGEISRFSEILPRSAAETDSSTAEEFLRNLALRIQNAYRAAIKYAKGHAFRSEIIPYSGDLFGFDDFLLPYIQLTKHVLSLPESQPIYLLLDDADSLTETQTRVVNSWVARRLSSECSLKVAAQVTAYKTTLTTYGTRIESPHDFQEIDLSEINTRAGELSYRHRISNIVAQRLKTVGVVEWPEKYFPEDHKQFLEISREAEKLKTLWSKGEGRGNRARDDVQRYARPEYIRQLGGARKSRNKYSYSGFEQLVHISSGVPRFFLEAAADMFDRTIVSSSAVVRVPKEMSPAVQNEVVRDHAQRQFIWDIRDLRKDVEKLYGTPQRAVRLHNLINGLGSLFEAALIDEKASERKYFSFAFSDTPDPEIESVLELGLRYGYFFRSSIGRKEGVGRTSLYILSRRLAPLFNLDPMGFAAYKFMTTGAIRELMDDPDKARKMLRKGRFSADGDVGQPLLPFERGRTRNG